MKVAKFGGSSVASAAQMRKVAQIVGQDKQRRVIVVSAPGKRAKKDEKVTDLLIELARAGIKGSDAQAPLARVIHRFGDIVTQLKLADSITQAIADDLTERVRADTSHEERYTDTLKAAGEDHCARIFAAFLRQLGHDAHYVNPRDAGLRLSDEPGNARVLTASYGRLRKLRDHPGIVVFPGFFGYSERGNVVTFPRGGSDISGAILAAAVDATVYENFTDVDSVYVADPRIVNKPKEVAEITYREMRELSYAGASVFHDEALEPVFHAGIPVNVRNTNNPTVPGTMIVTQRAPGDMPVAGIAATAGFCSLYVSKYLMNREIGFGRRVLQIFEDEGVPFEHMPTGIDNLSLVIRESRFSASTEERVVRRIRQELAVDEVAIERDLALVMVVGEGMRHMIGAAGRACMAMAKANINLEMINQGSSEVSMMFAIKAKESTRAVRALYGEFFGDTKPAKRKPRSAST